MAYNLSNIRNAMNKAVVLGSYSFGTTPVVICQLDTNAAYTIMVHSDSVYIELEILGTVITKIKSTESSSNSFQVEFDSNGYLIIKSPIIGTATIAIDVGLGTVKQIKPSGNGVPTSMSDAAKTFKFGDIVYNTQIVTTGDATLAVTGFDALEVHTRELHAKNITADRLSLNSISLDNFYVNEAVLTNKLVDVNTITIGNWQINKDNTGNKISITKKQ